MPKNSSVASRVLHTSPLSKRPARRVSCVCDAGSRGRGTFYLCEDDATLLWLDGRGIEGSCVLEDLCPVEMEQRACVLVLLVEVHPPISPDRVCRLSWHETTLPARPAVGIVAFQFGPHTTGVSINTHRPYRTSSTESQL